MEVFLLGPLEVRAGRERLPLGGPRPRAVLADLVLHAGSVVSMDTLIDDLWGADPPVTAEAVVQNAVSRLRKALGKEAIETRPPGYVLRVDPGAIDARRFERLVHEARPLPSAERSAALRDALALWRGRPFADLGYATFLQEEIARLDELRLTALEDRIEAEIELGRHDDVIADAASLASQHRDRERLCRLVMLALHRAGRQQEALDTFEATRRALDEQWGLEPSEETRALQRMILRQDPAIAPTETVSPAGGAVRRPVSLLLVELLLDEELELETAGAILDDVRRTVADVVARHGGSLSPGAGVELVAAFGAEGAREDDVLRAARSAVELREILLARDVRARFAVGTGRLLVDDGSAVLVGPVVGRTRQALRDAQPNDIQLTEVAARLGGDAFDVDADGRLLGVRPGRAHPVVVPTPLVGRHEELAALRSSFERVVDTGLPRHTVVVGEAGIGKSRLVAAFAESVKSVVLQAACIPYGEGISFLPLRELADRAAELDADAPTLGELDSADAALAAARALLEHFTASGPVVVVLDDVHWAVPTFLDLVEYVVRAVDGPLLVLSVTRPELLDQRPTWRDGAIVLESLSGDDARLLVDALPERDAVDENLATAILEAAEGVPLFLEQLAAHASVSSLEDDQIPPSLDALLASRVDALAPGERAVLSRAAVVGRRFSRQSLVALTPVSEARELDGRLSSLERRRFVHGGDVGLAFVHPLVHGAAYGAIGRAERAAMHESFARELDARGESDELVGMHLERAALDSGSASERDRRAQEASDRLGRAGERALLMLDYAAAANLLERAAALLREDDVARLTVECQLGHAFKGLGELVRAMDILETVAAHAAAAGNRRLQLKAKIELILPFLVDGAITTERAVEVLNEALPVLRESGDVLGVARAEDAYATVFEWQKRADSAQAHAERAEQAYRQLGLVPATSGPAYHALEGSTSVADAIRLCEHTLTQYPDRLRSRAYVRVSLALLRAMRGDLLRAHEDAATARAELGELGEEVGLHTTATMRFGSIEALAGNWLRAREIFNDGLEYVRDRPLQRSWQAYFLARLGESSLGLGDFGTAFELAEESRAVGVSGDAETDIWWRRVSARALAATGDARNAARLGREAVDAADATDNLLLQGEARLDLAEALLSADMSADAVALVVDGLARLDRKGALLPAANGRSRFAHVLAADGEGGATAPPSHLAS